MPSVKSVIRIRDINKKGECIVYIRYGHQQKSIDIATGIRVEPNHWYDEKQKVNSVSGTRKNKTNEQLLKERKKSDLYANSVIDKTKSELVGVARLLQHCDIEPDVSLVKEKYLASKKPKVEINKEENIITLFAEFIDDSNKSDTTKRNYGTVKYHLKEFEKSKRISLTVDGIDLKFYDNFTTFLYKEIKKPDNTIGLSDNTVTSTIKNLKVFLTYLEKRDYNFQHIIPHLKATYQDTPIYFLTEEELSTLYKHEFNTKRLEKVRDIFVLNCY